VVRDSFGTPTAGATASFDTHSSLPKQLVLKEKRQSPEPIANRLSRKR
jgi:hypothetical protein